MNYKTKTLKENNIIESKTAIKILLYLKDMQNAIEYATSMPDAIERLKSLLALRI
jgi:antitoxin component HigA of HigAB toxin-antitoxin module